ncbi:hypothetical protein [Providencia alcalifaciens]|uniref:hypothetical protein n=1 Tax=Providencia alcalifaciens TaxID=126385 RepID=UPI003D957914
MAKTAAERKAAQRKRQKESGETKFELVLNAQEIEMLQQNCGLRRPGKEPYEMVEYIQLLIIKDNQELTEKYKKLSNECCGKCGDKLPVIKCCLSGDSDCWATKGWHDLKLDAIGVTCHENS